MKVIRSDMHSSDKPLLIDFYADWCAPCKALQPMLTQLAMENEHIEVAAINIEDYPDLAEKYGISALPTLLLVNGDCEEKIVGTITKTALQQKINQILLKP